MSPPASHAGRRRKGFPRVSGDEPQLVLMGLPASEFSPRERG